MAAMLLFSDPWNPLHTAVVAVIPEVPSVLYASFKQQITLFWSVWEKKFCYLSLTDCWVFKRRIFRKILPQMDNLPFPGENRTEPKEINFASYMLLFCATGGSVQPFLGSDDGLNILPELPTCREGSSCIQEALWCTAPVPACNPAFLPTCFDHCCLPIISLPPVILQSQLDSLPGTAD